MTYFATALVHDLLQYQKAKATKKKRKNLTKFYDNYDKSPYTENKIWSDNTKTLPTKSISQQLRTNLGQCARFYHHAYLFVCRFHNKKQ